MEKVFKTRKRYQVAREVTKLRNAGVPQKDIKTAKEGRFFVVRSNENKLPSFSNISEQFNGLETAEDYIDFEDFLFNIKKDVLQIWAEKNFFEIDKKWIKKELILQICNKIKKIGV